VRAIILTCDARQILGVLNATSAGRERAIAAAREALANHPAAVVGQLEAKLAAAQAGKAPPVNDSFARFAAKCNGMLTMEQAGEDDIHGSSSSARAVSAARLDVEIPFAA
jgi:hypothetical protein